MKNNNAQMPVNPAEFFGQVTWLFDTVKQILLITQNHDERLLDMKSEMDERFDELDTKVDKLASETKRATRISRKASREIGEYMTERILSMGLPYSREELMRHLRPALVAALRKQFGGVNSYYDLRIHQVSAAYDFINAWSPSIELLERIAAKLRGPQIHVTVETRRWDRMSGGTNGGNARKR